MDLAAKPCCTIVGIPARNEVSTIAAVARAAADGLRETGVDDGAVVLADNGSTDGTVERFRSLELPVDTAVIDSSHIEASGKGTNVFALFDYTIAAQAERLILLDADLRSAQPSWVGALSDPLDSPDPTMSVPVYQRDRYEAGTTNHLVTPLLDGLFTASVQQPIGGEFGFNRPFLQRASRWARPRSAQLYGVDVWLTANALREEILLAEVHLGTKLHTTPFENVLHLPQQVVDSLLFVAQHPKTSVTSATSVKIAALPRSTVSAGEPQPQPAAAVATVLAKVAEYIARHSRDIEKLFPSATEVLARGAGQSGALEVTSEVWPRVLADAVRATIGGRAEAARDHLLALYVHRLVTFWSEIDGHGPEEVEELLERQLLACRAQLAPLAADLHATPATAEFTPGTWQDLAGPPPR